MMIVKTYPSPSKKYGELTCTAGIRLRDNEWIRIYPYPFRLLDNDYRFKKYDILELPLEKSWGDPRPDSYRLVDPTQVGCVGHLEADKYWEARMQYIRPTVIPSVEQFEAQMVRRVPVGSAGVGLFGDDFSGPQRGRVQWGKTIGVVAVVQGSARVEVKYVGEDWPEEDRAKLASPGVWEEGLFEGESGASLRKPKVPLRFCPYKFYLNFTDIKGVSRKKVITDWEIIRLYFREEKRLGSREKAVESVKSKVEKEIFGLDRETYIVVGSIHHHYAKPQLYAVIGFIWPKKKPELPLFSGL